MASDVIVKIKGQNELSPAVDSASSSLASFAGKLAGIAVAAEVLKKVGEFAADCAKEFAEDEKALLKFNAAIDANKNISSGASAELEEYAGKMALLTGEAESTTLSLEGFLASTGRNKTEIESLMLAAANLSAVTGDGLQASVEKLNATYDGSAGKLSKLIPQLGDLTKEQLEAGDAIGIVNKQFDGMAQAISGSLDVNIKNLTNSYGEFKAAIGQSLEPFFTPMIGWIQGIVDKWTDAINAHSRYKDDLAKSAQGDELAGLEALKYQLEKKALVAKTNWQQAYNAEINAGGNSTSALAAAASLQKSWSDLDLQIKSLTNQIEALKKAAEESKPGSSGSSGSSGPATLSEITPTTYGHNASWQDYAYYIASQKSEYDSPGWTPPQITDPRFYSGSGDSTASYGTEGSGFDASSVGGFSKFELVLNSLADAFGPLLEGVIGVSSVMQLMSPMKTIISAAMTVLTPLINTILTPLVGILNIVGQTLGKVLAPILTALTPIISLIGTAFVWLYNYAIMPFANVLISIGNIIYNMVVGIYNAVAWLWGDSMGYRSLNTGHLTAITTTDLSTAGASTASGTTASGSNASYEQARPINATFNFYNQGIIADPDGAVVWIHDREQELLKQGLIA